MRSRDHDVVLEGTQLTWVTGNLEWGGGEERGGQFMSNLRPGWMGSYHTKEGFQVSKGELKGCKEELARGKKARGLRHKYVSLYTCI
jgi:hypothetical protein